MPLGSLAILLVWPQVSRTDPGADRGDPRGRRSAVAALGLPVETIGSRFGDDPASIPAPHLPAVSLERVRELFSPAVTVALLAAIESLLSAVVADGMIGSRHKSNVELVGQGIANIASALFGGIPATGAIARTATNIKNGGRTPVAGMVHALTVLLVLICPRPVGAVHPAGDAGGRPRGRRVPHERMARLRAHLQDARRATWPCC